MYLFILIILSLFICRPLADVTGIAAIRFIPIATFLLGTLRYMYIRKGVLGFSLPREKRGFLLYFAVIALYVYSIFRVSGGGVSTVAVLNYSVQFILIFVLLYFFINYLFGLKEDFDEQSQALIRGIVIALNIFLLINFVVYLAGIGAFAVGAFDLGEPSTLANAVGISLRRDGYFLTGHPNSFGGFLAMLSMVNYLTFRFFPIKQLERICLIVMLGICAFSFLLIDSRGAAGAAGISVIVIEGARIFRLIRLLPAATVFIPVLTLFVISLLQIFAQTDYASAIARNPSEIASGNNRAVIWKYCVQELKEFDVNHVMGYGQLGHMQSGVSKKWSREMKGWETYTHNFLFQVVFDMGYLGLLALLGLTFLGANYAFKLYKNGHKYAILFLGIPILYMFSGITEAPFGLSNYLYTNLFFLLFLVPILLWDIYLKSYTENQETEPEQELEEVKKTGKKART